MENKKYPEPIEALLVVLVILGLILAGAVSVVLWIIFTGSTTETYSRWVLVLGGIPFLVIPLLYVKLRKYDAGTLFRFKAVSAEVLTVSILLGLAVGVIGDELDRLIQIFVPVPQWFIDELQFMKAESGTEWLMLILGVVLLAAFAEELLFRGFLQVSLERKGDPTRAVLLTSLTWTMVHMNPFWAIQIFIIGVVIGFLAWRTNSVIPSIIVHGMNNLLSLIFYNIGDQIPWYLMGNHVSIYLLLPAAFVLVWCIRHLTALYRVPV
jgi:membrane protease YdiL (CAAX protease family)